jgi:phosphatidylglycerophosphate synthase
MWTRRGATVCDSTEARITSAHLMRTMSATSSSRVQRALARWSEWHAIALLAAVASVAAGAPPQILMIIAAVSFSGLIVLCRAGWQHAGRFGAANALTSARVGATLALPAIAAQTSPLVVAACAIGIFALDGVDGWLARRQGLVTEFGEYLDKEADAFLLLVLCMVLYGEGRLDAWIVVPGLLRYAFVVFLLLARPPAIKEQRSTKGRWIYGGMIVALAAAFTPFPAFYRPLVALMCGVLVYSFADTLFGIYGRAHETKG